MSKRFPYSAQNPRGKTIHGFVDARTSQEALGILEAKGLASIQLHDDTLTAFQRHDLTGRSHRELAQIAKFELQTKSDPGVGTFLLQVIRQCMIVIVLGLGILLGGVVKSDLVLILMGAGVACYFPAVSLWKHQHARNYTSLLSAYALGNWDEALCLLEKLRPHSFGIEMDFDLDVREACIKAINGNLEEALPGLQHWKNRLDSVYPATYEARLASVYLAGGDVESYLTNQEAAYEISEHSATATIDLALGEAMYRDIDTAENLISALASESFPDQAKWYMAWINGIIALRRNESIAIEHLKGALDGMLSLQKNPAIWSALAVCSGYYALALHQIGETEKASEVVKRIWNVLKVHGSKELIEKLQEKEIAAS